jgi:SMI1 / KNR4 family (SUKH-1)
MEIAKGKFMSQDDFIRDAKERFSIVGPQTSEDEIETVFPEAFPGREDLKQFYLLYNGGSRTELGGTVYCGNPEHRVSRDHLEKIRVEGFFSISRDPQKRMLGFHSMLGCRATRLRTFSAVPEMKTFLERHMPIAFDHSGNYLWINLQNGHIQFLDWDAYREGPVEVAASFREFVTKFWVDAVLPALD